MIDKEALLESAKEFVRTMGLGMLIPVGAALGVVKQGIDVELGTFLIQWNVSGAILVAGFVGALQVAIPSAVDKWLHKKNVETPFDLKIMDKMI